MIFLLFILPDTFHLRINGEVLAGQQTGRRLVDQRQLDIICNEQLVSLHRHRHISFHIYGSTNPS